MLVKSSYNLFGNAKSLETSSLKLKFIKFGMFISFGKLLKVSNTYIHVWILNKLLPMDNANEYDLNYAMVYYTNCK